MSLHCANYEPLVSILINCYNGEKFLKEAMDSVIAQTYCNWEVIFWDNLSCDTSFNIAKSYNDSRIKCFLAETHTCLGEARKLASAHCNGEWIGFLDCDDIWNPTKLEEQIREINLNKYNDVGLVYGRCLKFGNLVTEKEHPSEFTGMSLPEGKILNDLILKYDFIAMVTALVNKNAFLSVGGFPSNYKQAEDYFLFCSIASNFSIIATNKICAKYRIHDNNLTSLQNLELHEESSNVIKHFISQTNLSESYVKNNSRYYWHKMHFYIENVKKGNLKYICNIIFEFKVFLKLLSTLYKKISLFIKVF